jgi:hypothetical protein
VIRVRLNCIRYTFTLTILCFPLAQSTRRIVGGSNASALDPALANPWQRRKIIYELKAEAMPHGNGLEGENVSLPVCSCIANMLFTLGVLARLKSDVKTLLPHQRYIHEISSRDHIDIVITMLPKLAHLIHNAKATLHDNTYKRTHGTWKEWEVVVWDDRLNMRTFAFILHGGVSPVITPYDIEICRCHRCSGLLHP